MSAPVRWRLLSALVALGIIIKLLLIAKRWWVALACCFVLVALGDWARRTVRRRRVGRNRR